MEPQGSLPCLQEPATFPYPQLDKFSLAQPLYFFRVHFNIILLATYIFQAGFLLPIFHKNAFPISPTRPTCLAHRILLDLFTSVFCEE